MQLRPHLGQRASAASAGLGWGSWQRGQPSVPGEATPHTEHPPPVCASAVAPKSVFPSAWPPQQNTRQRLHPVLSGKTTTHCNGEGETGCCGSGPLTECGTHLPQGPSAHLFKESSAEDSNMQCGRRTQRQSVSKNNTAEDS